MTIRAFLGTRKCRATSCCEGEEGTEKKKKKEKKKKAAVAAAALRIVDEDATGFRTGPAARMQGDSDEDAGDADEGDVSPSIIAYKCFTYALSRLITGDDSQARSTRCLSRGHVWPVRGFPAC